MDPEAHTEDLTSMAPLTPPQLAPNKRRRESTPNSLPSTVTSVDPPSNISASTEYFSSPAASGEDSSNVEMIQAQPAASRSDELSSNSDEQTVDVNPLLPSAFSTPPEIAFEPLMGNIAPFYPESAPTTSEFEDWNAPPSIAMYNAELLNHCDWTNDPIGAFTSEEYARTLAFEQHVPRQVVNTHSDSPAHMPVREHGVFPLINSRILAELDAINEAMEARRALNLSSMNPGHPSLPGSGPPSPPLPQYRPAQRDLDESAHLQSVPGHLVPSRATSTAPSPAASPVLPQAVSPVPKESLTPTNIQDENLKSKKEAKQPPAPKRARHSLPKAKISTPQPSTAATAVASSSRRLRSSSAKKALASSPPPSSKPETASAGPSSSRRHSKAKTKNEIASPQSAACVSPRRLRSSDVKPSSSPISSMKKGRGNLAPSSWEAATTADKMMSQMKESASATLVRWPQIAAAWNEKREAGFQKMYWRSLAKRWGRIVSRIGYWPGFDDALLEAAQEHSEMTAEAFESIAEALSEELGWEISSQACQGRWEALKEEGKVDVKGKGRARRK